MNYINLTPHDIILNDGRKFEATGNIARVKTSFTDIIDDVCEQRFGEVQGLPEAQQGVRYIVSGMVLAALKGSRPDVVSPTTGHSETKRNDKGHIVSVPCFVRGA